MPLQEYIYCRVTYYVDYRMKQFRSKVDGSKTIRFLDFDSILGDKILAKMISEDVADTSRITF